MKNSIFLLLTILFLGSCTSKIEPSYTNPVQVEGARVKQLVENGTAAQLIKNNCFTCHNPAATSHDDMLAPPLVGMKYKYQQAFPSRDTFIYAKCCNYYISGFSYSYATLS